MAAAVVASMLVPSGICSFDQHLGPIGAREELTLDEAHSESRQQEHRDHHASDFEPVVDGPGDEPTQTLVARR